MGLFDKLQSNSRVLKLTFVVAELELYRLEQKYARRKNRTTFTTGAVYQDGEYFYTSAADSRSPTMSTNSTGNSNDSSASNNKRRTQMWVPPEQRR
ncbi:uncharacterized protein Z520_01396 [Fonsecaea multimorphosa CBS 102226]|uniref:Uncharacterized protein n=1 Tax=Fonsecaea multimorphosa CBS 102226 TaxID=1442371 RepID=A0A0D2HM50_9EURO|nr:uncharacterized protein Z520_01396 [Fonsecaea multimorphosa CBS 102226]KIY02931.1 hypothetical protein Z520_01396 [Fonsecaea multimorphosa CBS 102226]